MMLDWEVIKLLRLIGKVQAKPSKEAELHAAFQEDRLQGEWFRSTERLVQYIQQYARL